MTDIHSRLQLIAQVQVPQILQLCQSFCSLYSACCHSQVVQAKVTFGIADLPGVRALVSASPVLLVRLLAAPRGVCSCRESLPPQSATSLAQLLGYPFVVHNQTLIVVSTFIYFLLMCLVYSCAFYIRTTI